MIFNKVLLLRAGKGECGLSVDKRGNAPKKVGNLCFRAHHSTDTALLSITDSVFSAMDRSEITLFCLLDCSKCFDVVPHDPLLRKLELYGIDTRWFQSYLAGHYQQVQVQELSGRCVTSDALLNPRPVGGGGQILPPLSNIRDNLRTT